MLPSGNLSAWWQLNMEMSFKPDSQCYENEFDSDLTGLPGWQNADAATRTRIINGAKKYVQEYEEVDYNWIGTNNYNRADLAGCRALQLLLQESPSFLDSITPGIWQRWAPFIVGFPSDGEHKHHYLGVVKLAYVNAPAEVIRTLMLLINQENQEHDYIFILNKFEDCWDECLKSALLEKVKDKELKPKCMGQLLEKIIKHESNNAREFAKSLIYFPLPSIGDERERTIIASKVLVENADPSSWSIIWLIIQQEPKFGREVVELFANQYSHGIHLNLTEKQLANFYMWLVHHYPHNQDPVCDNVHFAGTRESISRFRDSVLAQLKERGTSQACAEIQRLVQEFPELTWLRKTLLDAQITMRRKTWKPPKPDEIIQIVSNKQMQMMKIVLLLAANPKNSSQLRLNEEVREIDEGLTKRSRYREQFKLESKLAVRQRDFYRHMLDIHPQIVHFSGHGAGENGIVLEDETGNATFVQADMLASMFKLFASKGVECVLFNACYSEVQAEAVSKYIPYVIGMNQPIGDKAAIDFAVAFYDALGAGESMEFAFKLGCSQLVGLKEHETPVSFVRGVRM